MSAEELIGSPSGVEPILPVQNIIETITYWHATLGFPDKWTWGDPPDYGGVAWHGAAVQFSLNAELAKRSQGNAIFIKVRNLEALYNFHQNKNAMIVEPLENKPWGMAGYTVKEINGYYIVFAGTLLHDKAKKSAGLPSSVKFIERRPTVKEYQYLTSSVGWSLYSDDSVVEKLLAAPIFSVVAENSDGNEIIGCALLLGDHASFYYVKDVVVHPDWQSKHIGTALMKKLSNWLDANAANNALVALITGENMKPFYQQFGFSPAFCMLRYMPGKK